VTELIQHIIIINVLVHLT